MSFKATYIPYKQTGAFSKIITDYLDNHAAIQKYHAHPVSIEGVKEAIKKRKDLKANRTILVQEINRQYQSVRSTQKVKENIIALQDEKTFTICTAHQPNIFTGHLYFIYKILHTIKLADELKDQIPGYHFVPVYYMGSEDADLEELGEVSINGKKYTWQTKQTGAVGRMKIDAAFLKLISEIENQLSVEKCGKEIMSLVKDIYAIDKTIEQATFEFVHTLFAEYGLIQLLPDNAELKNEFTAVNTKELMEQFSHKLVKETIEDFPEEYKVQTAGREINLFYIKENMRERISREGASYKILNSEISFSEAEIKAELKNHPERFSQNVILRPVFQEMILPNVAFIGGGGELAYWLELKKVFEAVSVPFPVLVLRNSFMVVKSKTAATIRSLELDPASFFYTEQFLIDALVKKESTIKLDLSEEKKSLELLYQKMNERAVAIDFTLKQHIEVLKTEALKRIGKLEKKMFKAEKKKFEAQQRQIQKIRSTLFPVGTLQERVDNLLSYYAVFGKEFIKMIYENSKGLEQEFCIMEEAG